MKLLWKFLYHFIGRYDAFQCLFHKDGNAFRLCLQIQSVCPHSFRGDLSLAVSRFRTDDRPTDARKIDISHAVGEWLERDVVMFRLYVAP